LKRLLEGRRALVTGGARGIGAAIARAFAGQGADIVLTARTESSALRETCAAVEAAGSKVTWSVGDVSDSGYVKDLVARATADMGGVDILVNNAGMVRDANLPFITEKDWDAVVNTSLKGAYLCSKELMRGMLIKSWGRIINISSISALSGREGQTSYSAAKAGLIGFTRSLARECAPHNVLVNSVIVGAVDTRMTRQLPRPVRDEIVRYIPLGRLGRAEEIAGACVFLASELSSYVTGAEINVSGGGYI